MFASQDGRWSFVSTSMTAVVAGSVAWLAMAAAPPASPKSYEPRREQAALPYDLLIRLSGTRPAPSVTPEDRGRLVLASFTPDDMADTASAALDAALAEEMNAETPASLLPPGYEARTVTVGAGDTLIGLLTDAGANSDDAVAVVGAMRPVFSPRSIRPGQVFEATFGPVDGEQAVEAAIAGDGAQVPARLLTLSFSPSIERMILLTRGVDGTFQAEEIRKELEAKHYRASATIDSSLYLAAMQAGIPASIVVEMIRMFSYDVDFQRDVHPGDSFEVFFDRYYTPDGEPAKEGDIYRASMTIGGKKRTLYRFESADGIDYFDANGQSAKSMLMKTPVDGARLTSGYGMRRHPVLGYNRMHKGIDFGAPTGTPVMAAGAGTVVEAGRKGTYGNYVRIRHGNGYETAYAHLSRFASGVRKGTRVRQGQTIAYSGATGRVTGPHLHYEILVNHAQVNPLRVKVATGRKLQGAELATFTGERNKTDILVATVPVTTKLADASGLRTTTTQ